MSVLEDIVGYGNVLRPLYIQRSVAVGLVGIDCSVAGIGVVALFDSIVVYPHIRGLVVGASRHGNAVVGILGKPEISDLAAGAALHLKAPLDKVSVIADTLDGNILAVLHIQHIRAVVLLTVVGLCARGHVDAADKAEAYVLGLAVVEYVVQTCLSVVGYGVLVVVIHIDNGDSRFQGTVIVICAYSLGAVPVSIAAAIKCHGPDCTGSRAVGARQCHGIVGIALESGDIHS